MLTKPIPWRLDPGQIEVVDEAVAVVLRAKTPAERIAIAQIRARHPDWADAQVQVEVART
jgi:hypothetical protein